jgi:hypothetical protein
MKSRIYLPRDNLPMPTTTVPCSGKKNHGSAGGGPSTRDVRSVMGRCSV